MDYPDIEDFVASSDASTIRTRFDSSVGQEWEHWKLAIMVWIANGERQDLETEFPNLAGANPANHDWSQQT